MSHMGEVTLRVASPMFTINVDQIKLLDLVARAALSR